MKIAIPVKNDGSIDDHFGHCDYYKIFTISQDNQIVNQEIINAPQGCGCKSNIASVLQEKGVTIMLAGGIGGGAINVLGSAGIEVVRGCSGIANQIVQEYLAGNVEDSGNSCAQHELHHVDGENEHICQH